MLSNSRRTVNPADGDRPPPESGSLREEIAELRHEIAELRREIADPDAPDLLSVEQAARRLSISERTLRSFVSDGTIRSLKIGRRRLVPTDALRAFVEDRTGDD